VTPAGTRGSLSSSHAACTPTPSSERIVLPTPITTVSEDRKFSMSRSGLGILSSRGSPRNCFRANLGVLVALLGDRRPQFMLGNELVTTEDAFHHSVLLFNRNQDGCVEMMNEEHPEHEHHQEMNFAKPLNVNQV